MTACLDTAAVAVDPRPAAAAGCSQPRHRRPPHRQPPKGLLPVLATVLWAASLTSVHLSHMTDIGLVSILPWAFFAALLVLTVSFFLLLGEPQTGTGLLALHVVVLIVIVHASPAILYGTLRYSWAWKHVGVIDFILRHGGVDPRSPYLSPYHNWPGFFALSALLTKVAGAHSALSFASWAPAFFNLTFLGGLVLVFQGLTGDRHLIWLAVWLFFVTSWIGQDYFAPQAFAYFLWLVTMGICLRWLRPGTRPTEAGATGPSRPALVAIVALIMATVASSHQLTPFMMISSLSVLAIFGGLRPRTLPVVMAVLASGWIIYGAAAFLTDNVPSIIRSIGQLESNTSATFINLSHASAGQALVARIDRVLTASVFALAAAGAVRRWRCGLHDLTPVLLMAAPLPMLAANPYGGEMVFRVYFFALPFAAFLIASLLCAGTPPSGRRHKAATVVLSVLLLAGLLFSYYGKERMYHFSPDEVAATRYIYSAAPRGAEIISITTNYPFAYQDYERYRYLLLGLEPSRSRSELLADPARKLANLMADSKFPTTYLLITQSQVAEADMTGIVPAGALGRIEAALRASRRFRTSFSRPTARVWRLVATDGRSG